MAGRSKDTAENVKRAVKGTNTNLPKAVKAAAAKRGGKG